MAPKRKRAENYDDQYSKLELREQILKRPDTYVGSLEKTMEKQWIYNWGDQQMELRDITYAPGLYKIFDEILVNAADNKQRDDSQTKIKVDINKEKGFVKVWNNGLGIPVHIHKKEKLYIPDMIFGHLLTSGNYDDDQKRTTGGRNGFGAKLANIFSTKFTVETSHGETGKAFKKTWTHNMTKSTDADITDAKGEDFTCITFWPDFKLFGMEAFEEETTSLFEKRVIDIAGVTDKTLKVTLNGKLAPVQHFEQYVELYPGLGEEKSKFSYAATDRWQVCVRPSNIDYHQVSFVNSICTMKGGKHVEYVVQEVVRLIKEQMKKKMKNQDIPTTAVKPFLWVFVNAKIENPSFDSQTKETLNTTKSKFGSVPDIPPKLIDTLHKVISERILDRVNNKINKQMASKVAGAGKSRNINVPKLDDANDAGTKKGHLCTLILTEGDSAKSMVTSGLGKVGRDRFGCFPLRGKLLNVRDASQAVISKCAEVQNLMKILGLKPNQKYTSTDQLRYGSVMIMTDQDYDGSHIKGLLINMFHALWPELIAIPGFLVQFITPIVKAFPVGSRDPEGNAVSFFTIPDFVEFKENQAATKKRWHYKYYKGLGTSSTKEAKDYFENIETHKIDFVYDNSGDDSKSIRLAFDKKMVDARKKWITDYKPNEDWVDYNVKSLGYSEFINKELILFSIADCERSIPNVIDGMKPGQRKILFCCFKRNLTREIKVAQFSGYVSEHAAYHHGEMSLQGSIVAMAQNFTGSNNLPLLVPCGQFGSRASGGKDASSARYIFTKLDPVTRCIFPKVDDNLLTYKDDDGLPVEPEHYLPIIPTALLNGTTGIGTGFSTSIPNHNPRDLIQAARELLDDKPLSDIVPWYRGFTGGIKETGDNTGKFVTEGVVSVVDSSVVRITELPVKYWSDSFKDELMKMQQKGIILEFRNHITGDEVDVDVAIRPDVLRSLRDSGALMEFFGLSTPLYYTNLICFDAHGTLHKYDRPADIIKEWFGVRFAGYIARKKFLIEELERTCLRLENMVRFIKEVNEGTLQVRNRKKQEILGDLKKHEYAPFTNESRKKIAKTAVVQDTTEPEPEAEETEEQAVHAALPSERYADRSAAQDANDEAGGYGYLLGMKIWSLTYERARQLEEQLKRARTDLDELRKTTEKEMWLADLNVLEEAVEKADRKWEEDVKGGASPAQAAPAKGKGRRKAVKKIQTRLEESDVKIPAKETDEQTKNRRAFIDKTLKKVQSSGKPKRKRAEADAEEDEDGVPTKKKPRSAADKAVKSAKKPPAKRSRRKVESDDECVPTEDTSDDDDDDEEEEGSEGSDSGDSDDSDDSDDASDEEDEPPAKKARKAATKKAPKPAAKRAAQNETIDVDDDSDEDEMVRKPARKPVLKAAPKLKAEVDDDDDDMLNFDLEKNLGLDNLGGAKRRRARKIDSDSD